MSNSKRAIRNIAIIAHVDHGKTTLVDQLLRQSGTFRENQQVDTRVMDSNDLEKERGITILSKNCAVEYEGTHINIVDTPGHADFGGEVERVLSMVDSVLLLVDAQEGPMPQTRFVTRKALALGLKPIVVVNKIDRPGARPDWAINATFELFDKLGATEEQLDFPVVYASGLNGYAGLTDGRARRRHEAAVRSHPGTRAGARRRSGRPAATADHLARLLVLRRQDRHRPHQPRPRRGLQDVVVMNGPDDTPIKARINQVLNFQGLERVLVDEAVAGDIVLINGIEEIGIGTTMCAPDAPNALPMLTVDEPTLTMNFMVNNSPLAGREGKFVTSRQMRDRLERELKANVALRVVPTDDDTDLRSVGPRRTAPDHPDRKHAPRRLRAGRIASARGVQDGRWRAPRAVRKLLTVDVEEANQGGVMEELGRRRGDLQNMEPDGKGRVRLEYRIPARGLIGFQGEFMTLTRGTGLMSHVFDDYAPVDTSKGEMAGRRNGVLISQDDGAAVAYAIWKLQDRGRMFVVHNDPVYEGMIIGIHSRDNDLVVNPIKGKQLTNVRASGTDEAVRLVPPIQMSLEYAVEFIEDDELVEITPKSIRLRKRHLKEHERKKASREAA